MYLNLHLLGIIIVEPSAKIWSVVSNFGQSKVGLLMPKHLSFRAKNQY